MEKKNDVKPTVEMPVTVSVDWAEGVIKERNVDMVGSTTIDYDRIQAAVDELSSEIFAKTFDDSMKAMDN